MNRHYSLKPNDVVGFFAYAEKLKTTYRHAVTSDTLRRESVAEHVWLAVMLAMVLCPQLTVKVDLLKLMKMLVVHDLGEAINGDVPAFIKDANGNSHLTKERDGLKKVIRSLPLPLRQEVIELFDEFEALETNTAKVAKAIDRFEALMQHNLIPIETWEQGDFDIQPYYKDDDFNFDPFVRELKNTIDEATMNKIVEAGQTNRINSTHIRRWKKNDNI